MPRAFSILASNCASTRPTLSFPAAYLFWSPVLSAAPAASSPRPPPSSAGPGASSFRGSGCDARSSQSSYWWCQASYCSRSSSLCSWSHLSFTALTWLCYGGFQFPTRDAPLPALVCHRKRAFSRQGALSNVIWRFAGGGEFFRTIFFLNVRSGSGIPPLFFAFVGVFRGVLRGMTCGGEFRVFSGL